MKTTFIAYALGLLIISSCNIIDIIFPPGHISIPFYNDSYKELYVITAHNHYDTNRKDYEAKVKFEVYKTGLRNYYEEHIVKPKDYNHYVMHLVEKNRWEEKLSREQDTLYVAILEDDVIKEVLSHRKKEFHYLLYKLTLKDLEKLNWVVTYPPDNPDFKIKDVEYIVINDEYDYER